MNTFYLRILKPLLFNFKPDTIHAIFTAIGELAGRFSGTRWIFGMIYGYNGPDISKTVDGITYRTPIILSAGFDPDGRLTRILPELGFGGEEIGSITANTCSGNPHPQLTRLVRNKSIIVYKGLRNKGVDALIKKLSHTPRTRGFVLGVSIARTNDLSASADVNSGIKDYVDSFRKLVDSDIGDYYTINISCPNSYTGETFIEPKLLAQLLPRLREVPCKKPIYLKMSINIPWSQFSELLEIADKNKIHGVIIGNLNKNYADLKYPEDAPAKYRGGLSGKPTFELSNELIRKTREKYGTRFTIIGTGGILSPDEAMEKFKAGADLIQLISGMIFEGPGLIKKIGIRYAQTRGKMHT